jgi:hypothetical protein
VSWKALFTGVGLLAASGGQAYVLTFSSDGPPRRWDLLGTGPFAPFVHPNIVNTNTHAVRYFLASNGYSGTNTAAELNALRSSFGQWQAIPGTSLKFEEGGLVSPPVDINTMDNTNILFWATNLIVNGGTANISGQSGRTFSRFFSDGTLVEADIVLNGVEKTWFADFSSTNTVAFFIDGTALHEIGHFIGLSHAPIGAASMFWAGGGGVNAQAGLTTDEVAAARVLYPQSGTLASLATLKGQVTRSGVGVFGAAVIVEDGFGNLKFGTVANTNGIYDIHAMPPGNYQVRITPLDPGGAGDSLIRGSDIAASFAAAEVNFLPTTNVPVTLSSGVTNTLNFSVSNAAPAFRIGDIRDATTNSNSFSWSGLPITPRPGQSNLTLGVASPNLPTNNATLSITGDGLTLGPPVFHTNAFGTGLNFISLTISVASNATPGLRTFVVTKTNSVAFANGFLEILPLQPDYNFDGLADTFQRQYFPVFTATNAAPSADPDGDGLNNAAEFVAGTNPTNALSVLKINSVTQTVSGSTVVWRSVAGKRYQVMSKLNFTGASWVDVGTPVTATNVTAQFLDSSATNRMKFYRVQLLP